MFRKVITPNARVLTASYTRSVHGTPASSTVTEKVSEMAEKVYITRPSYLPHKLTYSQGE
jgi:hypothetical protein